MSSKSYCATKKFHYYGLKLHDMGYYKKGGLPIPSFLTLSSGSEHDLEVLRPTFLRLIGMNVFADKAYSNGELNKEMSKNGSYIHTPVKLIKGECQAIRQRKKAADDFYSRAVSKVRQPIESWFNWLIVKSDIQRASTIRSTKGLNLHVFGSIATALMHLVF